MRRLSQPLSHLALRSSIQLDAALTPCSISSTRLLSSQQTQQPFEGRGSRGWRGLQLASLTGLALGGFALSAAGQLRTSHLYECVYVCVYVCVCVRVFVFWVCAGDCLRKAMSFMPIHLGEGMLKKESSQ